MDTEVLAVAEVDRLRRGVERGRDEPAIRPYDSRLHRRVRQQWDLSRPGMNIEAPARGAHALGDDLHRAGDAAENMGQFVGEGSREVTPF